MKIDRVTRSTTVRRDVVRRSVSRFQSVLAASTWRSERHAAPPRHCLGFAAQAPRLRALMRCGHHPARPALGTLCPWTTRPTPRAVCSARRSPCWTFSARARSRCSPPSAPPGFCSPTPPSGCGAGSRIVASASVARRSSPRSSASACARSSSSRWSRRAWASSSRCRWPRRWMSSVPRTWWPTSPASRSSANSARSSPRSC